MIEIIGDEAFIYCDKCGKPTTIENKYGAFCEDMCKQEDSIKAIIQVNSILETINNVLTD